jgi:hypothetical protein
VQVSVPATNEPGAGLTGKPVKLALMSAIGSTSIVCCAMLFEVIGSIVGDDAVATRLTMPVGGTTKVTKQTIDDPTLKVVTGGGGVHETMAPGGSPVTAHVASVAGLGPLLVQVTVPVTVLAARALTGKPLNVACKSAEGVTAIILLSALFDGKLSCVVLAAVVVIVRLFAAGAVNVLVHVIFEPITNGFEAAVQD